MPFSVKIPPMGESISSGILAAWRVQDGDTVAEGQPLFELETDKITSEAAAEAAGVIRLQAKAGDEVAIGQTVALIEDAPAPAAVPPAPGDRPAPTSAQSASPASPPSPSAPPPTASPAVRRALAETGVDPATLTGSGKGGRLTKADVLAAASKEPPSPAPAASLAAPATTPPAGPSPATLPTPSAEPSSAAATPPRSTRRRMTPLRRKIAERLVQAQHQSAHLTTFNECDMSAVMELRKQHQDAFVKRHGVKLGFMSFFCKAVVHALQLVPQINSQIDGEDIIENHFFDLGVAIGTDRGLIVPILRDADRLTFADIEKQIIAFAEKAKTGRLAIEDLQGGVFTITNGGIFGSLLSTPILNPPQSAILGMHAIQERPVARAGQVVIRPMMYLALSYDHRVVDGKEAVTFLVRVKEAIEDPSRLLFGI